MQGTDAPGVRDRLRLARLRGGVVLHDPALLERPSPEIFDPDRWLREDRLLRVARGRGPVYFLDAGERPWVLRHYRRGGLVGRFVRDRYLWTGAHRCRAFRELRLLAGMVDGGLPVPPPVAAVAWRSGLAYRADIMTGMVPGRPLVEWLREDEPDPEIWYRIGRCLSRFHRRGIHHVDLSAGNVLVDDEEVYLVDFDRGRIRWRGPWMGRALERIARSAAKVVGPETWASSRWRACREALAEGYARGDGEPAAES